MWEWRLTSGPDEAQSEKRNKFIKK